MWQWGALSILLLLAACDVVNPEEPEPAFVRIEEPLLVIGNDTLEHSIPDVWLFQGNEYYGTFVAPTTVPFIKIDEGQNGRIISRGGVWENFNSDRHVDYPFIKFDTLKTALTLGGRVDYRPVYVYFPDSLLTYAFDEGFEDTDVKLQRFGLREDTAKLERHTINPYQSNTCGIVNFTADRKSFEVISTNPMTLPRGTKEVYAEVKFRGNIKFSVGLVAEGFGFGQEALPLIIQRDGYNDDGRWRAAYFRLTPYLSSGYPGASFKLRMYAISDGSNRTLYLDNIRVLHFK